MEPNLFVVARRLPGLGRSASGPAHLFASCVLALTLAGACLTLGAPRQPEPTRAVCYECFWEYQEAALREHLVRYFDAYRPKDPLLEAERRLVLARLRSDPGELEEAFLAFRRLLSHERAAPRRLLVAETVAFMARASGTDSRSYFVKAAKAAEACARTSKAKIYRAVAEGRFKPQFGMTSIWRRPPVPPDTTAYVLGQSAIHVRAGWEIGVQIERTVRDWLSNQLSYGFPETPVGHDDVLDWHEGARLREILTAAEAVVVPLGGTLAARDGERWLASDERGVFRFEVLPDKVQYPTTRSAGDLALLVDTHGVSAVVGPAIESGVQMVIGCADYTGKIEAAYYLARRGIHVYFPCDRFVGDLVGHDAEGVLIGSGPVKSEPGGAVIGDTPVRFGVRETVVVEDASLVGDFQYYDAPARYFRRLRELLPLRLDLVTVDGPGQGGRVVRRAEQIGASAIAVRVWNEDDHRPVRDWLAASPGHRAVLFHTAPYAAGYRLFQEFPRQTTFGDTKPVFLPSAQVDANVKGPSPRPRG